MENKTIDKIGVGKNAGQVTKLELKSSNNVYEVYSDGVYIGKTREDDGMWTVEYPGWEFVEYYALSPTRAADLLDIFYKVKS